MDNNTTELTDLYDRFLNEFEELVQLTLDATELSEVSKSWIKLNIAQDFISHIKKYRAIPQEPKEQ